MKLSDIDKLGISSKTKKELEIDATRVIVDDEFNKNGSKCDSDKGYRERAIDRLIDLEIPFHSEFNMAYDMICKFVILVCPYCKTNMKQGNGGGCNYQSVNFQCPVCHSTGSLTFLTDGISFEPFKQKE
jgi:uncharacterized protein YbaR (Trm112 family)